jgi:hypothetical protein
MELAIGCKRFSSPAQARGRSEGQQGDATAAYCIRKGFKLIATFVDRGFSAYTGENSDSGDLKTVMGLAGVGSPTDHDRLGTAPRKEGSSK